MVDSAAEMYEAAANLAVEANGLFLDQFTNAERATDWRGNNNIAQSIYQQMAKEDHSVPAWLVCGAGTGGTSATLGRFIRYGRYATQLCVADPEGSVFHRHHADRSIVTPPEGAGCIIEGIGRARVEPSFLPDVIDRMIAVPDGASIGAMRAIAEQLGRPVGGSTGTNIFACLELVQEMAKAGETGSIVTILCDSGLRYTQTYYNDDWLDAQGIDWRAANARIKDLIGYN